MKKLVVSALYIFSFTNLFAQNDYLIRNISIIPMIEETVLENHDVLIKNGMIEKIGKKLKKKNNVQVIDGSDKYLIPGLSDMHFHFWKDSTVLDLYLANGVTAIRCASGRPDYLKWKKLIEQHSILGPKLYITTPLINDIAFIKNFIPEQFYNSLKNTSDVPQYAGDEVFLVTDFTNMENAVRKFKDLGYCSLKSYSSLTLNEFKNLCNMAKKYDMKVAGHLPWQVPIDSALYYGIDEFMHLEELRFEFYKNRENGIANATIDTTGLNELSKKLKRNNISITTTLILNKSFVERNNNEEAYFNRPEMDYLYPKTRAFYKENNQHSNYPERELELLKNILLSLNKNDVNIALGTDSQGMSDVHGFTVHDELKLLADFGLTNFEALETATINAAKLFNDEANWGSIEEGKIANMVMLDDNPLANIKNTRNIHAVLINGKILNKEKLKNILDQVRNYRYENDRLISPMEGR